MMIMLRKILLLAAVGCSIVSSCAQAAEITPEQALDIFKRTYRQVYGADAALPPVTVRAYDLPNNECLQFTEDETTQLKQLGLLTEAEASRNKIVRSLEGRKYFLVKYVPPPPEAGGPIFGHRLCFYVDRQTGMPIQID
jgi:hypothetical protein